MDIKNLYQYLMVVFMTNNEVDKLIKKYFLNDPIIRKCKDAFKDIKTFYKQPFINYNGKTEDTNEYYTEVVAEFLCDNITEFKNGVVQITRGASYKTKGHDGRFDKDTPREEEKSQWRCLINQKMDCDMILLAT